jgi:hypothetical protein
MRGPLLPYAHGAHNRWRMQLGGLLAALNGRCSEWSRWHGCMEIRALGEREETAEDSAVANGRLSNTHPVRPRFNFSIAVVAAHHSEAAPLSSESRAAQHRPARCQPRATAAAFDGHSAVPVSVPAHYSLSPGRATRPGPACFRGHWPRHEHIRLVATPPFSLSLQPTMFARGADTGTTGSAA